MRLNDHEVVHAPWRRRRAGGAALLVLAALAIGRAVSAEGTTWAIVHAGTLLAIPGQSPRGEQSILIKDGRISAVQAGYVGAHDFPGAPADTIIVDLTHSFVMPGLIDAHTHLQNTRILGDVAQQRLLTFTMTDGDIAIRGVVNAKIVLLNGFTSVRNVGDPQRVDLALKRAINAGIVPGPRMQTAGTTVGPTGTQDDPGRFRPEIVKALREMYRGTVCDGPDDCRRAVREVVKQGNDLVKIKSSGGVEVLTGSPDPRFTDQELQAMVETAHALGVKVAAHAISMQSIKSSLRAGVDSIEHGAQIDAEAVALFKRTGAFLVPTLEAPHDWAISAPTSGRNVDRQTTERIWNETKASIALAYHSGVKIAFGTDIGFTPHTEEPQEFLYMVEVGMTPADAIRAATVNAAELLGWSRDVGTIEPGKWADIIATPLSPLTDIRQMLQVSFVMKGGVVYKSQQPDGSAKPATQ